mmetsp:Transcript_39963/g.103445  ORF Transcript_39963/g.103445 Transcript_39963/m.103445 type:complete len:238 (-) Transcript_39963:1360-2073(-)
MHHPAVRPDDNHGARHRPCACQRSLVLGAHTAPQTRRGEAQDLHSALQAVARGVQQKGAILGLAPSSSIGVIRRPPVTFAVRGEVSDGGGEARVGNVHPAQPLSHVARVRGAQGGLLALQPWELQRTLLLAPEDLLECMLRCDHHQESTLCLVDSMTHGRKDCALGHLAGDALLELRLEVAKVHGLHVQRWQRRRGQRGRLAGGERLGLAGPTRGCHGRVAPWCGGALALEAAGGPG